MRKKVLGFITMFVMVFGVCFVMPSDEVSAAGLSLSQLQAKFPAGKYWNHAGSSQNNADGWTNTPCTHHGNCSSKGYGGACGCNSFNGIAIQCFGFAYKCGYDVYGSSPANWSKAYNLNSLKAGDIVRYKNNGHSIFVTGVNGSTVTYGDCNSDGHCKIRWNQTISKSTLASSLTNVCVAPYSLPVDTPDPPTLSVTAGNSSTETLFTWNSTNNAAWYDLKIWKGELWQGDAYHIEWGIKSTQCSIVIPAGTYKAYVDASYGDTFSMSNVVQFTVKSGCKLSVSSGNSSIDTVFSWNNVNGASEYDVKIWKNKLWDGDAYKIEWAVKSTSFSTVLPEGKYYAYVDTHHGEDMGMSNIVEIDIKKGCKLDVEVGNTSAETVFSWNKVNGASAYHVKIWKDELWKGDPYKIEWDLTTNSWSTILPEGIYYAYVDSNFGNELGMSNIVEINIKKGCKLDVEVGNTSVDTVFSWNKVNGASTYHVKIWKDELWKGDPYKIGWDLTANTWSTMLPEGTYYAYVDSNFGAELGMSNVRKIVINKGTKVNVNVGSSVQQNSIGVQ